MICFSVYLAELKYIFTLVNWIKISAVRNSRKVIDYDRHLKKVGKFHSQIVRIITNKMMTLVYSSSHKVKQILMSGILMIFSNLQRLWFLQKSNFRIGSRSRILPPIWYQRVYILLINITLNSTSCFLICCDDTKLHFYNTKIPINDIY